MILLSISSYNIIDIKSLFCLLFLFYFYFLDTLDWTKTLAWLAGILPEIHSHCFGFLSQDFTILSRLSQNFWNSWTPYFCLVLGLWVGHHTQLVFQVLIQFVQNKVLYIRSVMSSFCIHLTEPLCFRHDHTICQCLNKYF